MHGCHGGGGGAWLGGCVSGGVCGCGGHAWLPWGHAWLWGACVVTGGMCGCGGHVWLLGCMIAGVCMVAGVGVVAGVVCVVAGGCAWLPGACMVAGDVHGYWGVCMVAGGHAWLLGGVHGCWGGMRGIRRDTVNERAVRILLECILV